MEETSVDDDLMPLILDEEDGAIGELLEDVFRLLIVVSATASKAQRLWGSCSSSLRISGGKYDVICSFPKLCSSCRSPPNFWTELTDKISIPLLGTLL